MRAAIIDNLEKLTQKLGVVLVPDWRAPQIDEERHMRRLLKFLDIDCVFDVGANIGQYGCKLRRYFGYDGRILSFEPNPTAFAKLQVAASADPLWDVFPLALGREKGTAEFHAYEKSELGSLLNLDKNAKHAPTSMAATSINVQIETLAELLPLLKAKLAFERPFLKIDTQGFDLEVAIGAGDLLTDFLGIQSEVSFLPIYDGAPDFNHTVDYYKVAGFRLSRLIPIHDIHFPDLVEMDAILVRADLTGNHAAS